MTVAELIAELHRFPPQAPVSITRLEVTPDGQNAETVFVGVDRIEAGGGPSGYGAVIWGED